MLQDSLGGVTGGILGNLYDRLGLAEYEAINAWLQRIENLPGYIGMNS